MQPNNPLWNNLYDATFDPATVDPIADELDEIEAGMDTMREMFDE